MCCCYFAKFKLGNSFCRARLLVESLSSRHLKSSLWWSLTFTCAHLVRQTHKEKDTHTHPTTKVLTRRLDDDEDGDDDDDSDEDEDQHPPESGCCVTSEPPARALSLQQTGNQCPVSHSSPIVVFVVVAFVLVVAVVVKGLRASVGAFAYNLSLVESFSSRL